MANITVTVYDSTENKRVPVELPDDAPANRIIAVLVEKLQLPPNGPDGAPLSYKFHHKNSGRQIQDAQTLADAAVKDGDILRLQPEITAGARCPSRLRPDPSPGKTNPVRGPRSLPQKTASAAFALSDGGTRKKSVQHVSWSSAPALWAMKSSKIWRCSVSPRSWWWIWTRSRLRTFRAAFSIVPRT